MGRDFLQSDEIYIFTSKWPESFLIPTEANGAFELRGEIIERGYFDAQLAINAASQGEGVYCWPPAG